MKSKIGKSIRGAANQVRQAKDNAVLGAKVEMAKAKVKSKAEEVASEVDDTLTERVQSTLSQAKKVIGDEVTKLATIAERKIDGYLQSAKPALKRAKK